MAPPVTAHTFTVYLAPSQTPDSQASTRTTSDSRGSPAAASCGDGRWPRGGEGGQGLALHLSLQLLQILYQLVIVLAQLVVLLLQCAYRSVRPILVRRGIVCNSSFRAI